MKKTNRPNILLIMTDQLRGDALGYAGHPDVKTPYLTLLPARELSLIMHTAHVRAALPRAPRFTPECRPNITAG
mgnify:CR=1 FL=1